MRLQINVRDNRIQEVINGVLKIYPKPEDDKTLSDIEWVQKILRNHLVEMYKAGANMIAQENNKPDEDI